MKRVLRLVTIILVLTLSGCAAQPTDSISSALTESSVQGMSRSSESEISSENTPSESDAPRSDNRAPVTVQQSLSSGVLVDGVARCPEGLDFSALPTYEGSVHRFSAESAKTVLLGDEALVTEEQHETASSFFPNATYYLFETESGKSVTVVEENLFYSSPNWDGDILRYFNPLENTQGYNGDAFMSGKSFEFASIDESFAEIKATLSSLGVSLSDTYNCYVLDNETLYAEAKKSRELLISGMVGVLLNIDGEPMTREDALEELGPMPDYTADKDCYFFQLFASAEGVPITREANGIFENGGLVLGATIEAAYSADGIIMINVMPTYDVGEVLREDACLNLEGALDALDEKYNSIILEGSYEVSRIDFEYVPLADGSQTEVNLVPAWRFLVAHTISLGGKGEPNSDVEQVLYEYVLINAVTGKEIVKDMGGI